MAIQWGAWKGNPNGDGYDGPERVGISVATSNVSFGSSAATFTVKYYTQNSRSWSDNQSLALSGAIGGTISFNNVTNGGAVLRGTKTYTRSYGGSEYGSSPGKATFGATLQGHARGYSPSVTVKATIPARPVGTPTPQTGVTATRVSDTRQTVTWTRHTSAGRPYEIQHIYRENKAVWSYVAQVSGGTSTYTDTSTRGNKNYQYRVRAHNAAGWSSYSGSSSDINTTPATQTGLHAAKSGGSDIKVTWSNNHDFACDYIYIYRSDDGGGYGTHIAQVGQGATSYTDPSPDPAKTHTYETRVHAGNPGIWSPYSTPSNTVQLLTNPDPPSQLAPNGGSYDGSDNGIPFAWQHNSVDTTDQEAFEVRYRPAGGSWVSSTKTTSGVSSFAFAAATLDNGTTVEWQVRTWGQYQDPSDWSTTATFKLSSIPTVLIATPEDEAVVVTSAIALAWTYNQDESVGQSGWHADLFAGPTATGDPLETLSGSGETASVPLTTTVEDGVTYTAAVRVRSGDGLWSDTDTSTFAVDYALPPAPDITVEWAADSGLTAIDVHVPAAGDAEVDPVSVTVVRRANDDAPWLVIARDVGIDPAVDDDGWVASITDYIPPLNGTVTYRATATTDLPSSLVGLVTSVDTPSRAVWVNAGADFSIRVALAYDPVIALAPAREKVLRRFAGRRKPVEYAGEQRTNEINLSATIPRDAVDLAPADIIAVADEVAPACYRDPDGRRLFVSTGVPSIDSIGSGSKTTLAWPMTEVDFVEEAY